MSRTIRYCLLLLLLVEIRSVRAIDGGNTNVSLSVCKLNHWVLSLLYLTILSSINANCGRYALFSDSSRQVQR